VRDTAVASLQEAETEAAYAAGERTYAEVRAAAALREIPVAEGANEMVLRMVTEAVRTDTHALRTPSMGSPSTGPPPWDPLPPPWCCAW
jgi:hypothetical protein